MFAINIQYIQSFATFEVFTFESSVVINNNV